MGCEILRRLRMTIGSCRATTAARAVWEGEPLEGDAGAVAAGVGAAGEHATVCVDGDAVAAADFPGPLIEDVDVVAARSQPFDGVGGDASLGIDQGPLEGANPWRLDGSLD